MKWIKVRDGYYKYVQDDYNAPECAPRNKKGVPAFHQRPPWKTFEQDVHAEDNTTQIKGTDAFLAEREKWTQGSPKWERWEKGRKAAWQSNKPYWKKKRQEGGVV